MTIQQKQPNPICDLSTENPRLKGWFNSDKDFHRLYPLDIQKLANRHWTPLDVARTASEFLAPGNGLKILDIGSGVGKFCLTAGHYRPNGLFYGIEQRKDLHDYSHRVKDQLKLSNVSFRNGNFTQLDFAKFDHFYFYNSFYENITGIEKIDNKIEHSLSLFNYYNWYLYKQLEQKPAGTRIATYHSLEDEIPRSYYVVKTHFDGQLKFWIKA